MKDILSQVHKRTYEILASEYEDRVETLRPTTEKALSDFTNLLAPGSKILDIGCAVGYTMEILAKQINTVVKMPICICVKHY